MDKLRSSLRLWSTVLICAVVVLACNLPVLPGRDSPVGTPTMEVTNTPLPFLDITPTPSPGASPTPTSETEEAECTLRAAYVEDVTIPDDTTVEPGETFIKTWRIRNSGTCAWESGTKLAHVSGDDLGGPASVSVPTTGPDAEIEVSVSMQGPEEPGTYRSDWQLETPDGQRFGGVFYVQIVVPGDETPSPTPTPSGEVSTPPEDFLGAVSTDCQLVTFSWVDGRGESAYRLEGPGLEANLAANTTTYPWRNPPSGVSVVTLIAQDSDGDELYRRKTTVAANCGADQSDLAVVSVTFVPTVPVALLPVTVAVEVENQGAGDSGGFMARWWSVKTAPESTCRWLVSDGIPAGDTVELTCKTIAYSSSHATLLTNAEADTNDIIAEVDEENNALEATISVVNAEVVYDFVDSANDAAWIGGPPTTSLGWPGDPEDDQGFARWATGNLETGGAILGLCLETHPKRTTNGFVRGEYEDIGSPDYEIEPGDHFRATVALLEGANAGDVVYRVMLILSEAGGQWILSEAHSYGDGIKVLNVDLSSYAGQSASAILQVDGGETAEGDDACWLEAKILRYP
ncbi:MAG: NBR1-Ig-like domain-containing protein [Anaerolineae bacterium]